MTAHRIPARLRKSKPLTVMVPPNQWDIYQIVADIQEKESVSEWVREILTKEAARIRKNNPDRFKELEGEALASA